MTISTVDVARIAQAGLQTGLSLKALASGSAGVRVRAQRDPSARRGRPVWAAIEESGLEAEHGADELGRALRKAAYGEDCTGG